MEACQHQVIGALEQAPCGKMTIGDLMAALQLGERLSEVLLQMRLRGLVIFSRGQICETTEVIPGHG